MSNERNGNGHSSPSVFVSQPKLLPPLRNTSLHHRNNNNQQQSKKGDASRPSMPATATAAAVAVRLGRGHNLFLRNQPSTSSNVSSSANSFSTTQPTSITPSITTATTLNYTPNGSNGFNGGGYHHRQYLRARGGIYATTTTAQQDIVRLERDLEKILLRPHGRHRQAGFANGMHHNTMDPHSNNTNSMTNDNHHHHQDIAGGSNGNSRRNLFMRYSRADLMMGGGSNSDMVNEDMRTDQTRIAAIMSSILEVVERHKLATQLPFASDILGVLSVPFSQSPINLNDCQQALDIFDYIRERFKHLDPIDNFEHIIFCCRLLKLGQLKLKMRLVATLKLILAPCMGNPNFLPSSFAAFHALVYTLVDAFSSASSSLITTSLERPQSRHEEEFDHIQSSILDLLDKLSNGNIIPLVGMEWDRYFIIPQHNIFLHRDEENEDDINNNNMDSIPVLVARYCVVEALCRSLMSNTFTSKLDPASKATIGKLIIEKFLPRYWQEPDAQLEPAYSIVLYALSESATDWFINASEDDLRQSSSSVSLLLNFVQEKLTATNLQTFLPDWHDNNNQRSVYVSTIGMVLSILSITNLKEPHSSSRRSSPYHSPRPSAAYNMSPDSTWPSPASPPVEDLMREQLSTQNSMDPKSDFFEWRHTVNTLKSYFESFWNSPLNDLLIQVITDTIQDDTWEKVTQMYENLAFNMNDDNDNHIGEKIVHATLSTFIQRLVTTYPTPTPALCRVLFRLSQTYRTVFYRPVITCAASDDEHKISIQLTLITCLRKYMSGVQFWMYDAEMINVILLSDLGSKKVAKERAKSELLDGLGGESATKWGSTTVGQCVIAMEFMWAIKELREKQSDSTRNMEEDEVAKKFLIDLERRLSVFMTAKEKLVLIPIPLRVILSNIFLDARFFCNTTHRPGWLTRAIDWATQPVATAEFFRDTNNHHNNSSNDDDNNSNAFSSPSTPDNRKAAAAARTSAILHHHYLDDVTLMFQRIRITYAMTVDQLENETNEVLDYGDRPVSTLVRPSPQPFSTPLSTTGTSNSSPMEHLIDTLVLTSDSDNNNSFPIHTKRRQCMAEMYPISRAAAASLNLNPPHTPNVILATKLAKKRLEDMASVHQDPFGAVFSLLVAVFTSLTPNEFSRLVYPLWERFIDDRNPRAFVPAAFLLMQCAEKVPKNVVEAFTHDFYSSDPFRRLRAVEKQAALAGYRFNILAQEYIPTSSRKRPFRGDGGAFSTPFVPTDLGSNRFTMDEPRWMAKLKHASNFPIELKRQIQELGWDDDDQGEEHEALKKVLTPLALLPSFYLEEEDEPNDGGDGSGLPNRSGTGGGENESKRINVSKIIARRKRAATVHALTSANLSMVDLLGDDFGGVSNALRELLEIFLRDDPALFLRPFLGDLGKSKTNHQRELLTRLRYLVDLRSKLPPGFSYILFNYLAGMLKWLTRENKEDGLILMTLIHPILAELALSTNELSTRDLRKSKIEHLLTSTGRFWFTNEQPANMFPRGLTDTRTPFSILDIPWEIFSVAMLRISHIQFLTNFLTRYPREVYAVKKTLQDYEPLVLSLPQEHFSPSATNRKKHRPSFQPGAPDNYFPDIHLRKRRDTTFVFEEEEREANINLDVLKVIPRMSQQEEDVGLLSALRARVWLRFIDSLLLGLNKNYNDRNELERILKGVNMIIMEHNMDFEIIGQALILYTRVVTKFKRLFLGSRGHGIFLPALFKVFCEVERHSHVRSAITFAWCRFYAVHEETFVFQMLGALVPIILNAYDKSTSLGAWMTDNLFSLMQSMHNPPRLGATSDVLGLQLQVELDDHERSVQERIDAASNPMAMPLSTTILKPLARSVTAPIVPMVVSDYDNRPFLLQNFVKLFLTIIAYDPGSLRAEQFVKMMRHMLPRFCVLGNLTGLISEGIAALIDVFAKFSKNAKPAAATTNTSGHSAAPHINITIPHFFEDRNNNGGAAGGYDQTGLGAGINGNNMNNGNNTSRPESTQHAYGKQWQQNDRLTIKKEFVLLVNEFFKCRGVLTETNHEKMANIIRIIMRDYSSIRGAICPTDWIKSYMVDALQSMVDMRNYTKSFKTMLLQIYAQLRTQWRTVEIASIYEGFAIILENGQGKAVNMNDIAGLMMEKFVSFGISIATRLSDWESGQEAHTKFCNVLVRLIVAIMENSTQDVLREIERMQPSVLLIGKIIIPICLQYDLRWDYSSVSVVRRYRPEPTANWMRLMAYVSKCCSQASLLKSKSSGFSLSALTSNIGQTTTSSGGGTANDGTGGTASAAAEIGEVLSDPKDKKQQTPTSIAHLFSLSIVAMKVILLRGAKSLDKVKGSWVQVAYFLKGALIFGQTLKTLKSRSGRSSPRMTLSPALSPSSAFPAPPSPLTPDSNHTSFLHNSNIIGNNNNNTNTNSNVPLSTAILYDYATWCFLEFVVCYKSPLKLFLHSFLDEKLNEMGSRVSPSTSRSNSMLNSPSSMGGRRSTNQWKSWGQNDTGSESLEEQQQQQQQQPDRSPTCGLGLHIPSSSNTNTKNLPPVSPTLSVQPPSIDSSLANEAGGSPRAPSYNSRNRQNQRRPTSNGNNPASTELHIIHAETITALMNIQNTLGYKTTLPWGTDHLQNHTQQQSRPWTYRAAVSKVSYEWRLIMQLHSQLVDASTASSNSKLPTTPTATS